MDALKQTTIRTAAVIAEGVPERDTKAMIAYARKNNKVCDCDGVAMLQWPWWWCLEVFWCSAASCGVFGLHIW